MNFEKNMKLNKVLFLTFLVLTLIPIVIVSILLYNSGLNLSKESYTRNMIESINVQADYISQAIENNMISDYRFANKLKTLHLADEASVSTQEDSLLTAFQFYLEASEDKTSVCMLLDKNSTPIYTIGEKLVLDTVAAQLPALSSMTDQTIREFNMGEETYSLGIITPMRDSSNGYIGSLVSIYDKSYIFKIISSYYKIADTSTFICREDGEVINARGYSDELHDIYVTQALASSQLSGEGIIETKIENVPLLGYYKNIHNTPWYLAGFIDNQLILSFANRFLLVYVLIIVVVLVADILLSLYFSNRVVEPINGLINVMDDYQNSLNSNLLQYQEKNGYYETQYLRTKFLSLMKTILLVQHNFEGVYRLYQSSTMDDTNIDIDVKNQVINSNKEAFEALMNSIELPDGGCVVDKFINCFCEKDKVILLKMFENMRDEHLSVTCEAEIYTPHFNEKWFHSLVVPMYEDERLSRLFVQLRDITNFKKQEIESSEQVRRDALTHLYNRIGFAQCAKQALQQGKPCDMYGLLFIDMNYFKMVNDSFGHSAGDELLGTIGQDLLNAAGTNNIVARLGGDEFVIFMPRTFPEAIEAMKERVMGLLQYPFGTDNAKFVVSASIGVATTSNASTCSLDKLIKQADADMYEVKRDFKEVSEI